MKIPESLRSKVFEAVDSWVCENTPDGRWPRWVLLAFGWSL
jgi:hypothetical protein